MVIQALRWFATYLETRFPEKINPKDLASKALLASEIQHVRAEADAQHKVIEALKNQIEILNLRVGLTRPMQTVLRTKSNG